MSGGGGNTTTTQKFEAPDFTIQPFKDYLNNVIQQAPGVASAVYQGQTVAPQSVESQVAGNMASSLAQYGSPLTATAYGQLQNTAAGNNINPYATMGNAYAGDNPYLQSVIDKTNNDITNQFRAGTAAQTDSQAALQGAYGGSSWMQQQQANAKNLADSLANNENNLRMQNYNQSAQLAENQLNRATQGYQQDQANALNAAMASPSMEAGDLAAINAMNQYGNQNQTNLQNQLTAAQGQFNQQNQAPMTAQDLIANALRIASGSGGSSSSSIFNGSSGLQTGLGLGSLGLAGLSMFGGG
jgi:hypothetical protein